jgi:hypothetical protein
VDDGGFTEKYMIESKIRFEYDNKKSNKAFRVIKAFIFEMVSDIVGINIERNR